MANKEQNSLFNLLPAQGAPASPVAAPPLGTRSVVIPTLQPTPCATWRPLDPDEGWERYAQRYGYGVAPFIVNMCTTCGHQQLCHRGVTGLCCNPPAVPQER